MGWGRKRRGAGWSATPGFRQQGMYAVIFDAGSAAPRPRSNNLFSTLMQLCEGLDSAANHPPLTARVRLIPPPKATRPWAKARRVRSDIHLSQRANGRFLRRGVEWRLTAGRVDSTKSKPPCAVIGLDVESKPRVVRTSVKRATSMKRAAHDLLQKIKRSFYRSAKGRFRIRLRNALVVVVALRKKSVSNFPE